MLWKRELWYNSLKNMFLKTNIIIFIKEDLGAAK
jgi:hypothetical protein